MRIEIGNIVADLTEDQVADLRRQLGVRPPTETLLDAAAVAKRLGVSRETVYARAVELGGQKIGNGPKAPWRFDAAKLSTERAPKPEAKSTIRTRRRKRTGGGLLESRGEKP